MKRIIRDVFQVGCSFLCPAKLHLYGRVAQAVPACDLCKNCALGAQTSGRSAPASGAVWNAPHLTCWLRGAPSFGADYL